MNWPDVVHGAARAALPLLLGCGLHIGRPPASVATVEPVPLADALAEPGLSEVLDRALVDAAARHVRVDGGEPLRLSVDEISASTVVGGGAVLEARLTVTAELGEGRVTRQGAQAYAANPSDPLATEAARAVAFRELGTRLVDEAVEELLLAP